MSDPVSQEEIEDVLSSIRRLVSEERRNKEAAAAEAAKKASETDAHSDNRLILTSALRVPEPTNEADASSFTTVRNHDEPSTETEAAIPAKDQADETADDSEATLNADDTSEESEPVQSPPPLVLTTLAEPVPTEASDEDDSAESAGAQGDVESATEEVQFATTGLDQGEDDSIAQDDDDDDIPLETILQKIAKEEGYTPAAETTVDVETNEAEADPETADEADGAISVSDDSDTEVEGDDTPAEAGEDAEAATERETTLEDADAEATEPEPQTASAMDAIEAVASVGDEEFQDTSSEATVNSPVSADEVASDPSAEEEFQPVITDSVAAQSDDADEASTTPDSAVIKPLQDADLLAKIAAIKAAIDRNQSEFTTPGDDDEDKPDLSSSENDPAALALKTEPHDGFVKADSVEDTPPATTETADQVSAQNDLEEETVLDEETLRDLVGDIVRDELQGVLGERITQNVRKLVRREILRATTPPYDK